MKKVAAAALVLVAVLAVASIRAAADTGDKAAPPGVAAEMWHPLSDKIGVALNFQRSSHGETITGTLMVKERGVWRPVALEAERGLLPAR